MSWRKWGNRLLWVIPALVILTLWFFLFAQALNLSGFDFSLEGIGNLWTALTNIGTLEPTAEQSKVFQYWNNIGGMFNIVTSLTACFTVLLLLFTLKAQREELQQVTKAMKEQSSISKQAAMFQLNADLIGEWQSSRVDKPEFTNDVFPIIDAAIVENMVETLWEYSRSKEMLFVQKLHSLEQGGADIELIKKIVQREMLINFQSFDLLKEHLIDHKQALLISNYERYINFLYKDWDIFHNSKS